MSKRRTIHPEIWDEMNEAERMVQERTGFTWSWMNQFLNPFFRQALYEMATEIIRLRRHKSGE